MKNPYELAENILQSVSDGAESSVLSGGFTSIDLYGASVLRKDEDDEDCKGRMRRNECIFLSRRSK